MLIMALLAQIGLCAIGTLLAQMGRCPGSFLTMVARLAGKVAIGPVGQFGTMSPSDYDPAGPIDLCATGALLAQMGRCPRSFLSHAGPAGREGCYWPCGPVWDAVPI